MTISFWAFACILCTYFRVMVWSKRLHMISKFLWENLIYLHVKAHKRRNTLQTLLSVCKVLSVWLNACLCGYYWLQRECRISSLEHGRDYLLFKTIDTLQGGPAKSCGSCRFQALIRTNLCPNSITSYKQQKHYWHWDTMQSGINSNILFSLCTIICGIFIRIIRIHI